MSNKLTEKLLQGYELKSAAFDKKTAQPTPQPAPAKPQQAPVEVPKPAAPLAEGESYTISDKPDKFVCSIFESFQSFEQRSSAIAGKAYIFAATLILTALLWLKQEVLTQLPAVEVIFVAFLVTFIFNYYLINGALYKPFIENEQNSYLIKLCGAFAVASVACFFYALRFVELQNALIVFYSAFFLVIVLEAILLKESFKPFELITALGALVGTIVTINGASGTFWSESTPSDPSAIYGLVLAAVSAVCMALIMFNFSKMQAENFATMNHIFTMMIVLFVPIFFPIQGVVTPSLGQWVVLLICGLLTAFASLFFIRSFQLDSGARPAVYLFLQTAFIFGIEYLMSQASGFTSIIGAVITVACVALYSQQYSGKAPAQGVNDKEKGFYQEMNVINSN